MNLEKILQNDKRIWDEEILDYPQLFELARTYDKELLGTLFNNKDSKEKFFIQVGDSHVFKYNEFRFYLEENQVNNSFTQYANKIGLSSQGEHLSDSTDYVLDWPYKDCVLEGGMSSEEDMDTFIEKKVETTPGKIDKKTGTVISLEKTEVTFSKAKRKREEIFYNNIIADKEIDRLLDKKALKNFTRYTAKGEEKVKEIKRDEDGTIKENLLIKGNNLLALHSLKAQFAGKVKLIYIDPPYNTGNDGFVYNDRFNHSTWLTFMKNRLEIAKEFLREDGVIFVQCDDNEQHTLKLLLSEIQGLNFINTIIIKAKASSGASGGGEDKKLKKNIEYIHIFAKNNFTKFNEAKIKTKLKNYIQRLEAEEKTFAYTSVLVDEGKKTQRESTIDGSGKEIKIYEHSNYTIKSVSDIAKDEGLTTYEVYEKYIEKIFTTENAQTSIRTRVANVTSDCDGLISIEYYPVSGRNKGVLTRIFFTGKTKRLVSFLSNTLVFEDGEIFKTEIIGTLWDHLSWSSIFKEGGVKLNSGKKPEKLLKTIIELCTDNEDIVLDYHLGSGTTSAVAHKLNRQYIGIEQMDYDQNSAATRLQNVVNGDTTGISKIIDWKGGGDFIYFELAEYNEEAKNKIDACTSFKELKKLFTELTEYYFLNYNVSVKQFNDQILDDKDFQEQPLEEQKTLFKALLDNNQLYIPHKEQEDGKYNLSKEDQELTNEFYG